MKKMVTKNKERVKKEFDLFAQKIAKLEAIRHELDVLDTKGFEKEVKLIRTKLKDVSALPQIQEEMDYLEGRIKEKEGAKIRASTQKAAASQIRQVSKMFKDNTAGMRKKIEQLEGVLSKKKAISTRKQLSGKDVDYVRDIPKLEDELKELKDKFKEHTKLSSIKVDSGVGVLVDTKFDDFVSAIKGELSERLKEKEMIIDSQLKEDLNSREKLFAKKYRLLVDEFHNKYKQQVQNELRSEVKQHFEEMLDKKLSEERGVIVNALINENLKRLHNDRRQLVNKLEGDYSFKEKKLRDKVEKEISHREKELKTIEDDFRKRKYSQEQEFSNKIKKVNENLGRADEERRAMVKRLEMDYASKSKNLNDKMKAQWRTKKTELDNLRFSLINEKRRHEAEFENKVNEMKTSMHEELRRQVDEMKKRDAEKIASLLKQKEKEMRSKLEREYHNKAREEIKRREVALNKKKEALEQHIMLQAKKLFK